MPSWPMKRTALRAWSKLRLGLGNSSVMTGSLWLQIVQPGPWHETAPIFATTVIAVEGQHAVGSVRPAQAGHGLTVCMRRNAAEDVVDGPGAIRFDATAVLMLHSPGPLHFPGAQNLGNAHPCSVSLLDVHDCSLPSLAASTWRPLNRASHPCIGDRHRVRSLRHVEGLRKLPRNLNRVSIGIRVSRATTAARRQRPGCGRTR